MHGQYNINFKLRHEHTETSCVWITGNPTECRTVFTPKSIQTNKFTRIYFALFYLHHHFHKPKYQHTNFKVSGCWQFMFLSYELKHKRFFSRQNLQWSADYDGRGVCDRSIVGIAGSNSDHGMDVRVLWRLCVVLVVPSAATRQLCHRSHNFLNVCGL